MALLYSLKYPVEEIKNKRKVQKYKKKKYFQKLYLQSPSLIRFHIELVSSATKHTS